VKNVIKIVIKLAVLYKHNQLGDEDLILAEKFKNKFNAAALAIISFYEVSHCILSRSLVVNEHNWYYLQNDKPK